MSNSNNYVPPKVWAPDGTGEGAWAHINRPTAGAQFDKALPRGEHPLQLYSLATPNGVKVTILLEELLRLGIKDAEYDAHLISIQGDQFGSGFVELNPNSKIPALIDLSGPRPIQIFESGAILLHLADRFDAFIPKSAEAREQCLSWLFWQVGSAPYLGGGFGHFYAYAPEKIKYCIDRFTMEVKRQLDVLDRHLSKNEYMCGQDYSIADMAIWPWYGGGIIDNGYNAYEFLDAKSYTHLLRWAHQIEKREAVIRGRMVNRTWGALDGQLHERHQASDFELKTQDKLEA